MLVLGCKETKEQSTSATDNKETINSADSPEKTEKQSDGLTLLKGDFLYLADAAVLQTHREVYGVVIDEKMHELNSMASPYKKADTDMVSVEVRAKIFPKPDGEEGWDYRIEIKEILNVSEPKADGDDVIKLGN
ncbi:MAG: hypothetical protein KJO41_01515 [Bacteroidia bacterium]|nr:hypothetical protein [Bacteroidia bacterium]